jgi:hypothetical protein
MARAEQAYGSGVMIFSKGNLLWLSVFYTPDDPEGFVRELRASVNRAHGRRDGRPSQR